MFPDGVLCVLLTFDQPGKEKYDLYLEVCIA